MVKPKKILENCTGFGWDEGNITKNLDKHDVAMIECFDLVRDYPESKIAFIGLLLFIESEQNKSYGVQALQYIKSIAEQWDCTSLRLAVIENNQRALVFWKREGFVELFKKPSEQYSSNAIFMEYILK